MTSDPPMYLVPVTATELSSLMRYGHLPGAEHRIFDTSRIPTLGSLILERLPPIFRDAAADSFCLEIENGCASVDIQSVKKIIALSQNEYEILKGRYDSLPWDILAPIPELDELIQKKRHSLAVQDAHSGGIAFLNYLSEHNQYDDPTLENMECALKCRDYRVEPERELNSWFPEAFCYTRAIKAHKGVMAFFFDAAIVLGAKGWSGRMKDGSLVDSLRELQKELSPDTTATDTLSSFLQRTEVKSALIELDSNILKNTTNAFYKRFCFRTLFYFLYLKDRYQNDRLDKTEFQQQKTEASEAGFKAHFTDAAWLLGCFTGLAERPDFVCHPITTPASLETPTSFDNDAPGDVALIAKLQNDASALNENINSLNKVLNSRDESVKSAKAKASESARKEKDLSEEISSLREQLKARDEDLKLANSKLDQLAAIQRDEGSKGKKLSSTRSSNKDTSNTSVDQAAVSIATPKSDKTPTYRTKVASSSHKSSELLKIKGLGKIYNDRLQKAGIQNIEKLARFPNTKIEELSASTNISKRKLTGFCNSAQKKLNIS